MKRNKEFEQYAKKASRQLDDKKVRKDAQEEIYFHLLELYDNYIAEGLSKEEAQKAAIEEMIDADKLGSSLENVHAVKMKWWYFIIIAVAVLSLIIGGILYERYMWHKVDQLPVEPDKEASLQIGMGWL